MVELTDNFANFAGVSTDKNYEAPLEFRVVVAAMLTSKLVKLSLESFQLKINFQVELVLHSCRRPIELNGATAIESLHLHALFLAGHGSFGNHVHQRLDLDLRLQVRVRAVALKLVSHALQQIGVWITLSAAG